MEFLIGIIGIFFAGIVTILLAKKSKDIAKYLYIAYIVRVIAVLIHTYIYPLPVGLHDAVRFESLAWQVSEMSNGSIMGFIYLYVDFFNGASPEKQMLLGDLTWVYLPLLSFFYVVFDRSPLLLNSISLVAGVLTVYLSWKITMKVWSGNRLAAKKTVIIFAFFPPLVMYSSVTLREIFIVLFVQVFILSYIRWDETRSKKDLLFSLLAAAVHLVLHNPMFLVLMSAYFYPIYHYLKKNIITLQKGSVNFIFLLIVSAGIAVIFFGVNIHEVYIPYFGELDKFGFDRIVSYAQNTNYGNALYPSFVVPNSPQDLILLLPIRVFYFLFSPFFWDITSVAHILGVFDSLLYMYLSYLLFSRRHYFRNNKKLKMIIFIFIVGIVIYSFGVGNFANAMRHRVKFLILLVIIVAPFIFSKKR
jgi:hypothetical protein